jgi:hypothetical protein
MNKSNRPVQRPHPDWLGQSACRFVPLPREMASSRLLFLVDEGGGFPSQYFVLGRSWLIPLGEGEEWGQGESH